MSDWPRMPKAVDEDYANHCAMLGEAEMKLSKMQEHRDQIFEKVNLFFDEMVASHAKYDGKPEIIKP